MPKSFSRLKGGKPRGKKNHNDLRHFRGLTSQIGLVKGLPEDNETGRYTEDRKRIDFLGPEKN